MIQPPVDDLDQYLAERWQDRTFVAAYVAALQARRPELHAYLSSSCSHGLHDYCNATERDDGTAKKSGQCRFCEAPCVCPLCHQGTSEEALTRT